MVGRSAEIDQLLQAWELVKTGRGQTVEITGERRDRQIPAGDWS